MGEHTTTTATTARPEKKVGAAAISGAAVTVLVYLVGLEMPAEVAAAVVTAAAAVAGWLAPHTRRTDTDKEV